MKMHQVIPSPDYWVWWLATFL